MCVLHWPGEGQLKRCRGVLVAFLLCACWCFFGGGHSDGCRMLCGGCVGVWGERERGVCRIVCRTPCIWTLKHSFVKAAEP